MGFKRSTVLIYLLAVFWTAAGAGSNKILMSKFNRSVRMELNIANNALVPDTALVDLGYRGILLTSTEIGGVQASYWITMVAGQMVYAVPDSVVEITQTSIVSGRKTYDIRAFPPQYNQEGFGSNWYDEAGAETDNQPKFYSHWDDSIALYPIPVNGDSIYLRCNIEHTLIDSTIDTVYLDPDYREAAKSMTMSLVYRRLQEYDAANYYQADYERRKKDLREKRMPRMEQPPK